MIVIRDDDDDDDDDELIMTTTRSIDTLSSQSIKTHAHASKRGCSCMLRPFVFLRTITEKETIETGHQFQYTRRFRDTL